MRLGIHGMHLSYSKHVFVEALGVVRTEGTFSNLHTVVAIHPPGQKRSPPDWRAL